MPAKKKFRLEIKLGYEPIANSVLDQRKAASVARALGMPWPASSSRISNGPLYFSLKEI